MSTSNHALQVSVIIPAVDETDSLLTTVAILFAENQDDLMEVIIVIPGWATRGCRLAILELQQKYGRKIAVIQQKRSHYGGALMDGLERANGKYISFCDSDGETDPRLMKRLIAEMKKGRYDIISASRWLAKGGFRGYHPLKLCLNYCFQKIFARLYSCSLTDLTYGYRIYKRQMMRSIIWRDLRHSFAFETLIKPLRLGYSVYEVPTVWVARSEGKSYSSLSILLGYVKTGLAVRFAHCQSFLRQ